MSSTKIVPDLNKIYWRIDQWYPEIPLEIRITFKLFHDELLKYNKLVNLIGPKTVQTADAIHFADCIMACRIIEKDNKFKDIYDIGSGNGFPGLIFAIMVPSRKFFLVESDSRKAEFLKHMISTLKLKNVDLLVQTFESLPADSVSCAICRGFLPLSRALLAARKIFTVNGVFYHLKGEEWAGEVASLPTQLCSYWQPGLLGEYALPASQNNSEVRLTVIRNEKIQA